MAHVLITGSSSGLGFMAAEYLIDQGHRVVVHARNQARADETRRKLPNASAVLLGDVIGLAATRNLAEQANRQGRFDAVIHNVAVGYQEPRRIETVDGLPHVFAVNTLVPYMLTALMDRPGRLIYLSSRLHLGISSGLDDPLWRERRWDGTQAYSETKLHDVMLALALARLWPDVITNALEPGWVPTRMGGPHAPDDLGKAHLTQAWLAVGDDQAATISGGYYFHQKPSPINPIAQNQSLQAQLLEICQAHTGVSLL